MRVISEYYSNDGTRKSQVCLQDEFTYVVFGYTNEKQTRTVYYGTLPDAEDFAEDYVTD